MTKALELAQVPNFLAANSTALVIPVVNATSVSTTSNTTNFGTAFYINSGGDVGIGTSSPISKLDVNNIIVARPSTTSDFAGVYAVASDFYSAPSYTGTYMLQAGSTATGTTVGLNNSNLGSLQFINTSAGLISQSGLFPLVFATNDTERMRIDSSGNVGVGTTSPTSYAGYTSLALNNATSGGVYDILTNGTRVAAFFSSDVTTTLASITSIPLTFRTGNTERMRIDTSGRFTLASQPFFYASLTVAQTGYNSSSTGDVVVVYNSTTTNTGSHFNTSTGKFTAPVAGNYIFHASAYTAASSFQQNWLVVNGSRIVGTDWVHASSSMSLGFWLIRLAANDTVGFHAYNGAVTNATINIASEHTYFKGYLLS